MFANMYGVNKNHFGNFWKLIVLCNLIDLFPIASVALIKEPTINEEPKPNNGKLLPLHEEL